MALQVWLPLNGNLKNQGLENIGFINNSGFTINNSGKIGKCYLTNNEKLNFHISDLSSSSWSLVAWFYPMSLNNSEYQYIISLNTSTANDFTGALCCHSNKLCAKISNTVYEGDIITLNTWHHGVITYDYINKILKIYHNGILVLTQNNPVTPIIATEAFIGARGGSIAENFFGKLNDIRIYNHCLSLKEVKELSKGLIIHYPLNNLRFNDTISDVSGYLYNGIKNGTIITQNDTMRYDLSLHFNGSSYIYIPIMPFDQDALNNELTFSCWIKKDFQDNLLRDFISHIVNLCILANNNLRITWNHASSDLSYNIKNNWDTEIEIPNNKWIHIVFTFKDGIMKVYIDGIYIKQSDQTNNGNQIRGYQNQYIGCNTFDSTNKFIGNISDIRIYCTALSAEDIKALYEDRASIDKNGNFYNYEYIENQNFQNVNLNKQGLFYIPKEIIENNNKNPSLDEENIYTKSEFYEN